MTRQEGPARARLRHSASVSFRASGHANVKATHASTFEFVAEADLSETGTCIIGVQTAVDRESLLTLRGAVRIDLQCGELHDTINAEINPLFIASDPLIIRTHASPQHRSFCIGASKGAAGLDRSLVAALRLPEAALQVTVTELGGNHTGALFVVALAEGNRSDASPRALATLESADLILVEDPGTIRRSFSALRGHVTSLHAGNQQSKIAQAMAALAAGQRVVAVLPSGLPHLTAAAEALLAEAIQADVPVAPVPGPSSILAALSVAGLPAADARLCGTVPAKTGDRERFLTRLRDADYAAVAIEGPLRLQKTLRQIADLLGDRAMVLCRNLTRPGELILRGDAREIGADVAAWPAISGEFVLVIAPAARAQDEPLRQDLADLATHLLAEGVATKAIANALAAVTGSRSRDMFQTVLALKHRADR